MKEGNFAFIDSQNVNLGIRNQGWVLDWKRFRIYLQDRFLVTKAYIFLGYDEKNKNLYRFLSYVGYTIIFKPVIVSDGQTKGNVDAELVLHTMIQLPNYEQAIIVTDDGDFYCLIEYLESIQKFSRLIIPNKRKFSSLLRKFNEHVTFLSGTQQILEYKKSP